MDRKINYAIFGEEPTELEFGYDEDYYTCSLMKLKLVLAMQQAIASGCECFMSTLEQGAAMWGAEACAAIKQLDGNVELIAVPTSELQASRWHPERRERYFKLLETADEIVELSEDTTAEEYILSSVTHAIVLGDASIGRLADLAARAKAAGVNVVAVGAE